MTRSASGSRDPGPVVRALFRLGALAAIGFVLLHSDGITIHFTPWSQAIINGIVKYTYPPVGQAQTTVVLFLEQNLHDLGESYPVSYERHAEVLEALSVHRPSAVFMDFVFLDRRSDEQIRQLRQAICGLRDAGTRVYVAVLEPVPRTRETTSSLLACAVLVSAQMEAVEGASGVVRYAHGVGTDPDFLPTPAFAMASARLGHDFRHAQKMELIWGNGVAELNKKWMKGCEREGGWWSDLRSLFSENPLKSVKLRCPYTRTITVGHLLGSSNDEDVGNALTGSAVFYGAAFHLTGDLVASPVFDELPAVYLHAMAYDNLSTLEDNYKRAERQVLIPSLSDRHIALPLTAVVDAALLLVTVGILLLVEEPPAGVRKLRERLAGTSTRLKWVILGLTVVPLVVAMGTGTGLWAAGLGLPLIMAAIAFLDLAPPAKRPPGTLEQFVSRRLLALTVPVLAVLGFIVVDREVGLEAALLLVALPAYFLYKVAVARDMLFAATAVLLVLASVVIVFPPVNLGPRNVMAYVAFFEVARHLLKRADEVGVEYDGLRSKHHRDREWGWAAPIMPALDWLFAVCRRASGMPDTKTETKGETRGKTADAPA